jgi:hypothetical protein
MGDLRPIGETLQGGNRRKKSSTKREKQKWKNSDKMNDCFRFNL